MDKKQDLKKKNTQTTKSFSSLYPSLVAQTVKRLPTIQETRVRPLDREDPLEKEMATHSSNLAWKIPWTQEPGAGYCPWGLKESDTTEPLHFTCGRVHKFV